VCCSLVSSTSSMGRSGELSDFECGLVIGCHISKKSVRDTITLLKLPKSTAGDVIVKWKREGTTTTEPRTGRPRLVTGRGRWALKKVVRETRQTSSETITREFRSATKCPASTMTVLRELEEWGSMSEQLPINQTFRLWTLSAAWSGLKGDATGQWTVENVWFGVVNHTIPRGSPRGGFGCGECLENDTCQHV
jgi:transposase